MHEIRLGIPVPEKVSDELATGVIHGIIEQAKGGTIEVTMNNIKGRPFEVITDASGKLAWGVGGSSGGTT
ncbi:hypothetical protein ABH992_003293 [Bradyrhizobium yuanmingense]|uniref:Uncharacterized protein n=1 Tax=Bradyrhizobium yuanmingense TaxID=108015 RepID=A0ABV4GG13_9BRAD